MIFSTISRAKNEYFSFKYSEGIALEVGVVISNDIVSQKKNGMQ